jgi:hypothetical protein
MIVKWDTQLNLEVHKENIDFYVIKELKNEIIIEIEVLLSLELL